MSDSNKTIYSQYADKIFDKRYNSPDPLRRYVHRAQYQSIINQVPANSKVIDIGCGEGVLACLLAAAGHTVVGIDISEPNIVRANALAESMGVTDKVTFMVGDAENVPFADASFEMAISCHVLEHLPDFNKGLHEVYRVTKEKAIIALPTILNLCSLVQAGRGSFWEVSRRSLIALPRGFILALKNILGEGVDEGYGGHAELTHIWRYPWIMKKRLRAAGFSIVHFEASTLAVPYFSALVPLISLLDKTKAWPVLRNCGYGSTAVLKK